MLAVLGLLPMEDVMPEKKTTDNFPVEINYILLNDTIENNDSIVIQIPNAKLHDSVYLRVISLENHGSLNIIKHVDSLLSSEEVDYFVLNDPKISE